MRFSVFECMGDPEHTRDHILATLDLTTSKTVRFCQVLRFSGKVEVGIYINYADLEIDADPDEIEMALYEIDCVTRLHSIDTSKQENTDPSRCNDYPLFGTAHCSYDRVVYEFQNKLYEAANETAWMSMYALADEIIYYAIQPSRNSKTHLFYLRLTGCSNRELVKSILTDVVKAKVHT